VRRIPVCLVSRWTSQERLYRRFQAYGHACDDRAACVVPLFREAALRSYSNVSPPRAARPFGGRSSGTPEARSAGSPVGNRSVAVLPQAARLDEERLDLRPREPLTHRPRGVSERMEAGGPRRPQRSASNRQHLLRAEPPSDLVAKYSRVLVDQGQHPQRAPLDGAIEHEVVSPGVVRVIRTPPRDPGFPGARYPVRAAPARAPASLPR
jgi:hypothetical protein